MLTDRTKGTSNVANMPKLAAQLNQAWFPINPSVLATVQENAALGAYDASRDLLVDHLKGDCSLYLFSVRELSIALCRDDQRKFRHINGRELADVIYTAPAATIRDLFKTPRSGFSTHNLESLSRAQAERLEDGIISSTAAQLLSSKLGVSQGIAFQSALLRQLGMTLIAWNYPNVYRQALDLLRESHEGPPIELDSLISSILGFSPSLLGVKVAQIWGVSDDVASMIGMEGPELDSLTQRTRAASAVESAALLSRICAVGEALARASRPQIYPTAQSDWDSAERVVRHHLGPNGIQQIFEQASALSDRYMSFAPQYFDLAERCGDASVSTACPEGKVRLQANLYLRSCPKEVKDILVPFYEELTENVSNDLLRRLIHEAIPELGFDSACIFTVDPSSASLIPVLRTGNPLFVKPKPVSLLDGNSHLNPIRTALSRKSPMVEEGMTGNIRKQFYVGSLGGKRGIGVVYLELSNNASSLLQRNAMLIFQAIRQTLKDLLMIS